jgi:hypothetical protein
MALPAFLPLWAAFVGTAIYRLGLLIAQRLRAR